MDGAAVVDGDGGHAGDGGDTAAVPAGEAPFALSSMDFCPARYAEQLAAKAARVRAVLRPFAGGGGGGGDLPAVSVLPLLSVLRDSVLPRRVITRGAACLHLHLRSTGEELLTRATTCVLPSCS